MNKNDGKRVFLDDGEELREIKFRVWNGETFISPDYITRDGRACWKENGIPHSSKAIEQYTGLHDKNGKDIYEWDIVRDSDERWEPEVVKYGIRNCGCCHSVYGFSTNGSVDIVTSKYNDSIEVIGNIHENKELLEE